MLLDLFSRRVVGWATAARPEQELTVEALHNPITVRRPAPGLVHHSDRGGHYASADYQDLLDRHGMNCSMSRPGNCLADAVVESFFHALKIEWLYHHRFRTRVEARLSIFDYIEGFYNPTRLHSALGYRSPQHYETLSSAAQLRVHFVVGRSVVCKPQLVAQLPKVVLVRISTVPLPQDPIIEQCVSILTLDTDMV